jgi:hypothetical protein
MQKGQQLFSTGEVFPSFGKGQSILKKTANDKLYHSSVMLYNSTNLNANLYLVNIQEGYHLHVTNRLTLTPSGDFYLR